MGRQDALGDDLKITVSTGKTPVSGKRICSEVRQRQRALKGQQGALSPISATVHPAESLCLLSGHGNRLDDWCAQSTAKSLLLVSVNKTFKSVIVSMRATVTEMFDTYLPERWNG